jgi:hypothetical protein
MRGMPTQKLVILNRCYFVRVISGVDVLLMTDLLSQNMLASPSAGIPIILSLYQSAPSFSVAILRAVNSLPNEELSMVFCLLEYQLVSALFKDITIPKCEHLVTLLPVGSASTKQLICTKLPHGSGAFGGKSPAVYG